MESRHSSSDNEGDYSDRGFGENFDFEADKNRIVEQSPKGRFIKFNEELGSGAYKTVYKAYDNETGCEVAWNVIKLSNLPSRDRKRISDEIALLKRLKHPNIINFISAWVSKQKEEIVFIAEVVTGGSLKKYLKKIKSPRLKVIKSWCREILQGIEYLHSLQPHPIIHRDIKCDNIFINSNKGEIRIGDLGLATLMSNAYAASVLGTPEFMAPEMYDEVYGPSVDIYSFGMCVLEMVTNQTPYRECSNTGQIYKKVIEGIKPVSLDLIANEEVKAFICDCLKPTDERPSATELLNHKFLQTTDQEAESLPIALYESQEEKSHEIVTKPSAKDLFKLGAKLRKHFPDESDVETEKDASKATSNNIIFETTTKQDKQVVKPKEIIQRKRSSVCLSISEKDKEKLVPSLELERHYSLQNVPSARLIQDVDKKSPEDTKSDRLPEKLELSPQQQAQQSLMKKDQMKYSFHSKGIMNGFLVILLKVDTQGRQYDHIVEIRRDRISYEKISRKLQKHLNLPNNYSEPYFAFQMKLLFESLDSLNISTSTNSILPPINSATMIPGRSPSNGHIDIQSNSDKNVNNGSTYPHLFASFYEAYLIKLSKEYLLSETEDSMTHRHRGETLELQNKHLFQKRNLWDRKQNFLSNSTLALYGPPIESQTTELEDAHNKVPHPNDSNFKPPETKYKDLGSHLFFSPLSSGPLSPAMSCGNLYSANNSVEIMASLLKKLGNTLEDQSRSNSHHPDNFSETDKITRSNLVSPNNQELLCRAVSDKGERTFKFCEQGGFPSLALPTNHINATQQVNVNAPGATAFKISPKNNKNSNVTSPKGIVNPVISPRGLKTTMISPQNSRLSPSRAVSDKVEPQEKKTDTDFILVINEKAEDKSQQSQSDTQTHLTAQLKQISHLPKTTQVQEKKQNVSQEEKKGLNKDAKKGNRYGSLTINTDIVNQGEKPTQVSIQQNQMQVQQPLAQQSMTHRDQSQRQQSKTPQSSKNVKPQTPNGNKIQKVTNESDSPSTASEEYTPNIKKEGNVLKPSSFNTFSNSTHQAPSKDHVQAQTSYTSVSQVNITKNLKSTPKNMNQPEQINQIKVRKESLTPNTQKSEEILVRNRVQTVQYSQHGSLSNKAETKVSFNFCLPANSLNDGTSINAGASITPSQQQKLNQSKEQFNTRKPDEVKFFGSNRPQIPNEIIKAIKNHKLRGPLGRNITDMDTEDIKMLQSCLEILTGQEVTANGHFGHYTENQVRVYQEKMGLNIDGIVNFHVWDRMIDTLDKVEKKGMTKEHIKQKEIDDMTKDREEMKKKIKDKQNKEASESLNKIQSKILDLSNLM